MFRKNLLRIGLILLLMIAICGPAQALTFEWDANTDNPIGYVVYFNEKGDTDTPYNTAPILHPTSTITVDDIHFMPGVTYECWAKAYNGRGLSEKSNVVEVTLDPFTPPAEQLPIIFDVPAVPVLRISA